MKHGKTLSLNRLLLLSTVLWIAVACKKERSPVPQNDQLTFDTYWYQDEAEISSYTLQQSRYGTTHDGKAVLIFEAEDFSKKKFVKLEEPQKSSADATRVLKFNMNKEFVTGLSKNSMMISVFTPTDYKQFPHSLKLVAGTQDWSGQSFSQFLWKGNRYEVVQYSYVESQGDGEYSMVNTWLEDEMWNKIRVAPNTLPIGDVKMIASASYLQLSGKPNKIYKAKTAVVQSAQHYTYSIQYPELSRTLAIDFEIAFPHKILGWKETYGINEVTTGTLLTTIMSDYNAHRLPQDEALRDSLLLNK